MSHQLLALGVWSVVGIVFLTIAIACMFYPHRVQRLAVRQYESSRHPLSRFTTWVRRSELFVWYLRAVGVASLWGVILSVFGFMQVLTEILRRR